MTRAQYLRDVVPRLVGVTLPQLMAATGLSNASCSTLRRGLTVPHPRHWGRLARLAADVVRGLGARWPDCEGFAQGSSREPQRP